LKLKRGNELYKKQQKEKMKAEFKEAQAALAELDLQE
jgi:hypothetical protein